ncbi:MAG: hypothetical protein ABIY47_06560 [Opitutaceae bacterium]
MTKNSLNRSLAALLLLGNSIRDGLMGGGAFAGLFDESLGCLHVAGFYERFGFVLGADVVGWPHLLHLKFLGDEPERVAFLP